MRYLFLCILSLVLIHATYQELTSLAESLQQLAQLTPKKISSKPPTDLTWCTCIDKKTRMEFAHEVVDDIVKNFDPKTFTQAKPFVYVSLASGGLLQDFRILKQLIREHKFFNIYIMIIDIDYDLSTPSASAARDQIPLFEGQLFSLMPREGSSLQLSLFTNVEDYIFHTNIEAKKKPHIVLLVDPLTGYNEDQNSFKLYPKEVNSIKFSSFCLFKPYGKPVQLWESGTPAPFLALDADLQRNRGKSLPTLLQRILEIEPTIKPALGSSIFLKVQDLLRATKRPETLYYHLYHPSIDDRETIVRPFKEQNIDAFITSDQVPIAARSLLQNPKKIW